MEKPGHWFLLAKCVKKHPQKNENLSKDAGQWPASLVKMILMNLHLYFKLHCTKEAGPILESKGMHAIFRKKSKKKGKNWQNIWKLGQIYTTISGATLLFEHLPIWASEIEHFEIFSCPWEKQIARPFFIKFNLLLLFLILRIYWGI